MRGQTKKAETKDEANCLQNVAKKGHLKDRKGVMKTSWQQAKK